MKKYLGLRGPSLGKAVGLIAGLDFMLFGYDQGVMGGILTMDSFLSDFPSINPNATSDPVENSLRSTYQGISVASYNLGCFLGSLITIFVGNILGRKRTIIIGTAVMIIGAALQASATTLPHLIIGRIITGMGNGANTSTVPMWQSETSKAHNRGKLVMIEGALITCGVMISYWMDLALSFAPGSVSWRFPLAFQILFCVGILAFIPHLPESPRWLVMKNRDDEAREILAALDDTDPDDRVVKNEMLAIKETVEEMSKGKFSDLFTMGPNRNFHRVALAYVNQWFQQISGINLITYYAAVIYGNLGMSSFMSLLLAALNGTEYFIASWPAVWLVERAGRRNLMLFGSIGQAATMAILAGVNSRSETGFQIAGVVFLFVFNTFFAVGWLGMSWLYPAEIVPLRIRAPANALSTSGNWISNFLVVMIVPVAFSTIGHKTYIIFAVINAAIVPLVYFFYPETAYRSLEEMDTIFHKVSGGWRGWFDVVHQAKVEPRWFGKNGEMLLDYEQTDEHRMHAGAGPHVRAPPVAAVAGGVFSSDDEKATEQRVDFARANSDSEKGSNAGAGSATHIE